jgi:DNA polymerase-3 subunit delta
MPIYVYWGEDDFAIEKAIALLRDRVPRSRLDQF